MSRHMSTRVNLVNTYYPLLPLLFPQPDELLVLPRDKVDCGVLQQGGKHKQETHGHPNVNGFHIRHLERDTSQSVEGLLDMVMVFPGPVQFLWHTLTHISGRTAMAFNESLGCERLTHSQRTGHECDPEECLKSSLVREVTFNCVGISANEPRRQWKKTQRDAPL